jgi:hypothetical protein
LPISGRFGDGGHEITQQFEGLADEFPDVTEHGIVKARTGNVSPEQGIKRPPARYRLHAGLLWRRHGFPRVPINKPIYNIIGLFLQGRKSGEESSGGFRTGSVTEVEIVDRRDAVTRRHQFVSPSAMPLFRSYP